MKDVVLMLDREKVAEKAADLAGTTVEVPENAALVKGQARAWGQQKRAREREADRSRRVRRALSAGYDPISPPESWYRGWVEHPCHPVFGHMERSWAVWITAFSMGGGMVLGMLLLAVFLSLLRPWLGTFAVSADELLATALPWWLATTVVMVLASSLYAWVSAPSRVPVRCLTYRYPIPAPQLQAYLEAEKERVFDRIEIWSPSHTAFNVWEVPRAQDPLMLGVIGEESAASVNWESEVDRYFLITCWDLSKDLEFLTMEDMERRRAGTGGGGGGGGDVKVAG